MKILVTGSEGFIAKNLIKKLEEQEIHEVLKYNKSSSIDQLKSLLNEAEFIFHLAGVNRPKDKDDFIIGNVEFTKLIIDHLVSTDNIIPIVFTSSIQANLDNPYGKSKLNAENLIIDYSKSNNTPAYIYRLPNVFGKWCKPNYNSAVATFCYNISRDIPVKINDRDANLSLVYIDDVCSSFLNIINSDNIPEHIFINIDEVYQTTVGEVVDLIKKFKESRQTLITEKVGLQFERALYSTYLSYLDKEMFSYKIPTHSDERGNFVEMLKTRDSGQFSFFTAHPGITRGGHYHHTKNEKFLILQGSAKFRFKNILSQDTYCMDVDSESYEIVETIPGWAHDITNTGSDDLIVMFWANEIFDESKPDTFSSEVGDE